MNSSQSEQGRQLAILKGPVEATIAQLPAEQKFQLIYCDPPFYSKKVQVADRAAFSDRWASLNEYLQGMADLVRAMAPRVAPNGYFALHCDWHASHYLKVLGDRIFGYENFRNEIVWHYKGRRQPAVMRVNSKHDVILVWAGSTLSRMAPLADEVNREAYIKMKRKPVFTDEDGREWIWGHNGRGRAQAYRIFIDDVVERGLPIDDVWEIPIIPIGSRERVGFPTQKPLALLLRLVELLTSPGDWIADFMAGSGTLGEAGLKLDRNVVLGDRNPEAIKVMEMRLSRYADQLHFEPADLPSLPSADH